MKIKLWISIIVVITITLGGGVCYYKKVMGRRKAECILNQRNATQSVAAYLGVNGLNYSDPLIPKEVFDWFQMSIPDCPHGGTYTWSGVLWDFKSPPVRCSDPNHQPAAGQIPVR